MYRATHMIHKVVLAALLILLPVNSFAQDQASDLILRVRTVTAKMPKKQKAKVKSRSQKIDMRLKDLAMKFEGLKFSKFEMTTDIAKKVQLDQKLEFALDHGQVLFIKPMGKTAQGISLWLNWKDGHGADILDTKLNLPIGESMVTGMDASDDSGMLLAVNIAKAQ